MRKLARYLCALLVALALFIIGRSPAAEAAPLQGPDDRAKNIAADEEGTSEVTYVELDEEKGAGGAAVNSP